MKKKVKKNLLWCVELYVDKSWTIGNREKNKLLDLNAQGYRRMLKIIWVETLMNEEQSWRGEKLKRK